MKTKLRWMAVVALMTMGGVAQAAFVTIGNAGNAADTSGYGAVGYTYQISATEVTIAEFQASGAGNGNENLWNDGMRSVGTNAPAVFVTLYEARKYCNFLTTGNVDSGYYGAGGNSMSGLSHDAYAAANGMTYFLPTEDEWYKAAYYTGNGGDLWSLYAAGDDTVPTHGTANGWNYYDVFSGFVNGSPNYTWTADFGGQEQNGTYNMMGNVAEWMEDSSGMKRGGSYYDYDYYQSSEDRRPIDPSLESPSVGFRVVAVPEPATAGLLGLSSLLIFAIRRMQKAYGLR